MALKDAAEELESQTGITPAIPSLHFSILKHGTYIPIHVDDQSKILSVMLYLASPEQNNNVNLGTSFWYPHNPNNQILDSTGTAAYEDEKIQNAIRSNFLEHITICSWLYCLFLRPLLAFIFYDGPT